MSRDHPGVYYPPLLIFTVFFLAGLALDRTLPPGRLDAAVWPGVAVIAVAVLLMAVAAFQFRRARTAIEPWRPATSLIESGFYRHSRNPIYVGFAVAHLGAALAFGSLWAAVGVLPALVVLRYAVIAREERHLERKFGEAYLAYKQRVPRWL